MNREERRKRGKKGNTGQPSWAQQGRTGQRPGAAETSVPRGRNRVSQERGGAKK